MMVTDLFIIHETSVCLNRFADQYSGKLSVRTSALDPELTREVLNTITQLAADGLTLVVVTHEMGFARNVSDRIIFMENGIVAEEAPAKEFFLHPKQEASKRFLRTVTDDFDYSI